MDAPSAKRTRADSDGTPITAPPMPPAGSSSEQNASLSGIAAPEKPLPDPAVVGRLLDKLPKKECRDILYLAATAHSDVFQSICAAIRAEELKAATTVLNFDFYSKDIWKDLNVRYRSMSGSKQCDIAGQVEDGIIAAIKSIVSQAGSKAICSFQTKRNGLEVLRKIGKSIVLSKGDTLNHEVHKRFAYDSSLEDGMLRILKGMNKEERASMRCWDDRRKPWVDKLVELLRLSKQNSVLQKLDRVLDRLDGDPAADEDDYHSGDQDEDEDEDEDGDRDNSDSDDY